MVNRQRHRRGSVAEHNEHQMQCRGEPGGRSERLGTRLQGRYREGLSYQEAEQLCLRMYYNFESTNKVTCGLI